MFIIESPDDVVDDKHEGDCSEEESSEAADLVQPLQHCFSDEQETSNSSDSLLALDSTKPT